jgi:hypothetical protein
MVHEDDAWIISLENYGYKKTDISDRKNFRLNSEQFTLKYSKKMPGAKLKDGEVSEYDDAMGHRVGGSFEMGKRR